MRTPDQLRGLVAAVKGRAWPRKPSRELPPWARHVFLSDRGWTQARRAEDRWP